MENYKTNSNKSKAVNVEAIPDKKIEKIISGSVKSRKKNEAQKFAEGFISEDANKVKSYILMDIIVPTVKKTILDVVTNGLDMILNGETGRSQNKNLPASKVSYARYWDEGQNRGNQPIRPRSSGYGYYDDIIFETRGEAEEVLLKMDELINQYGLVSIADLKDMVGLDGNYTDCDYGWTNIHNTNTTRVRDGYLIKLPRPLPIK